MLKLLEWGVEVYWHSVYLLCFIVVVGLLLEKTRQSTHDSDE